MVRGLVLDKNRGNILKMDRHKYVKIAYHGLKEMSKEDKVATYGLSLIQDAFDGPNYALVGTLFSLAEAFLFAQLVDFMDSNPGLFPESLWDYTNVVMSFLCEPRPLDGSVTSSFDWLQYFDVVLTVQSQHFFKIIVPISLWLNLNLGSFSILIVVLLWFRGNVGHLHKLLSLKSSSQECPKLGWRTMLVVPELEREAELFWKLGGTRKQLKSLRNERDCIENKIHHLKWFLNSKGLNIDKKQKLYSELENLESEREKVRISHQQALKLYHQKFHGVWGQLMKTDIRVPALHTR